MSLLSYYLSYYLYNRLTWKSVRVFVTLRPLSPSDLASQATLGPLTLHAILLRSLSSRMVAPLSALANDEALREHSRDSLLRCVREGEGGSFQQLREHSRDSLLRFVREGEGGSFQQLREHSRDKWATVSRLFVTRFFVRKWKVDGGRLA